MPCDNDVKAWNLVARVNSGEESISIFAGLREEISPQISQAHRDSIPEQSHSKVISGWIGHWVSLDSSLLIQPLAHGCHSIISKAEMRNWRAEGVILQLCFLTCLLPVNIATRMMRVTAKLIQSRYSIRLCGTDTWVVTRFRLGFFTFQMSFVSISELELLYCGPTNNHWARWWFGQDGYQ